MTLKRHFMILSPPVATVKMTFYDFISAGSNCKNDQIGQFGSKTYMDFQFWGTCSFFFHRKSLAKVVAEMGDRNDPFLKKRQFCDTKVTFWTPFSRPYHTEFFDPPWNDDFDPKWRFWPQKRRFWPQNDDFDPEMTVFDPKMTILTPKWRFWPQNDGFDPKMTVFDPKMT